MTTSLHHCCTTAVPPFIRVYRGLLTGPPLRTCQSARPHGTTAPSLTSFQFYQSGLPCRPLLCHPGKPSAPAGETICYASSKAGHANTAQYTVVQIDAMTVAKAKANVVADRL